ncbi:MAG: rhodanese-like domain-containing protein [Solirubrobacterales bacterium]
MESSVEDTDDGLKPFECDADGAEALIESGARLVDVRTAHEFDAGRIPDAERIGLEDLPERRGELSSDRPVLFYCRIGNRSLMAAQAFSEAGFEATSLAGGLDAWLESGRKVEPEEGFVGQPGEAAAILETHSRAASS